METLKRKGFFFFVLLLTAVPETVLSQEIQTRDRRFFCRSMDYPATLASAQQNSFEVEFGNQFRADKSSNPPEIGEERAFNVFEFGWIEKTFRLMDKTASYYLWMDVDEIAGQSEFSFPVLRQRLMDSSLPESINPNAGVLETTRALYGEPPDFDQDGILDILLYDIEDAYGYVTFADQILDAPEGIGNKADILYIATIPEEELTASVIAHELSHLIHFRYGGDHTFIFEGLGEYGEVANGYEWYPEISYWQSSATIPHNESPLQLFEYELPMFYWGIPENRDYQRANHFFTYLGEQFDPALMGEILRNPLSFKGGRGLDAALAERGTSLNTVLRDFHVANLINDAGLGNQFVHNRPSRQYLSVPITEEINGEEPTGFSEGRPLFQKIVESQAIAPGAVRYVKWNDVSDFVFEYDALGFELVCSDPILLPLCDGKRAKLRASVNGLLIGKMIDGSTSVLEIVPGQGTFEMNGDFEFIILALSHSDLDLFDPMAWPEDDPEFTYAVSWTPLSLATAIDQGRELPVVSSLTSVFPNPFGSSTTIIFDVATSGDLKMKVIDMLGREFLTLVDQPVPAGSHVQTIDTSSWPSGAFIIVIEHGGRVHSRLVQKVRL